MAGSQGASQQPGRGTVISAAGAVAGSRRRSESVNPAPALNASWEDEEMDEDDNKDEPSGGARQQELINKMLHTAMKTDKKIANAMLRDKENLIKSTEASIDAMVDEVDKEIHTRVEHIEKIVSTSQAVYEKISKHQVEQIEEQLVQLSLLLKDFDRSVDAQSSPHYSPELHVQHRKKHSKRVSYKAAMVAMKETEQAKREQQVQADMKRFTQAHKDLFKTLGSGPVAPNAAV